MNWKISILIAVAAFTLAPRLGAQTPDSSYNVNPPVTKQDLRIAEGAAEILNSPSKWNRADTRVCKVRACKNGCPTKARTFSLYCALEKATGEVGSNFEHRGAAMQEARFIIDEIAVNRQDFQHRLQGYNNDPTTTFADVQKFFLLLEDRIRKQLAEEPRSGRE